MRREDEEDREDEDENENEEEEEREKRGRDDGKRLVGDGVDFDVNIREEDDRAAIFLSLSLSLFKHAVHRQIVKALSIFAFLFLVDV